MKKVYVVLERDGYTDFQYCGVYGTRDQAEKRIKEIVKEFSTAEENLYIEEGDLEV